MPVLVLVSVAGFWAGCGAGEVSTREEDFIPIRMEGAPIPAQPGAIYVRDVELHSGELLHAVVEQLGVDVELRLRGPSAENLAEVDGPTGGRGAEELFYVAEAAGRHRVEVLTPSEVEAGGRFAFRVAARRAATAADRERVRAERAERSARALLLGPERAEAIPRLRSALDVWVRLGLPRREAQTRHDLCHLHQLSNQPEVALAYCEQAVDLFRRLGDDLMIAVVANRTGSLHQRLGRVRRSLGFFEEAAGRFRSLGERRELALALTHLGTAHHRLGELRTALGYFEQAVPIIESTARESDVAAVLLNYGSLLVALNRPLDSLALYRRAEALCRRSGGDLDRAGALQRIAYVSLRVGELDEAEARLEEGIRILHRLADRHDVDRQLAIAYVFRGRLLSRRDDAEGARAAARRAIELSRRAGDRQVEGGALLDLGERLVSGGDPEGGLRHLERALELLTAIEDRTGEALARIRGAEALYRLGRLEEAWERAEPALEVARELRTASDRFDVRTDYFSFRQEFFEVAIDVLMALHAEAPTAGHQLRALEVHESRRARELLDAMSASVTAAPAPRPARFDEIRRRIAEEESWIVVYSLGEARSYAWWITPEGVESRELGPRAKIEKAARDFARELPIPAEWKQESRARTGRRLSEMLLAPLVEARQKRRLVVVADGDLQRIPFAALPMPRGAEDEDRARALDGHFDPDHDYLVRHLEVAALPSLSTLLLLRRARSDPGTRERWIAAFGDPVFTATDPRVGGGGGKVAEVDVAGAETVDATLEHLTRSGGFEPYQRLEHTRREVAAILELAPRGRGFSAVDFSASRETFFGQGLERYRILHFATHAYQDPDFPELSGLVLSLVDPEGAPRSGFLHAFEISRLHLPAELVVLSACQTGRGKTIPGEGVMGLNRAFFDAGAARVISSLWRVDDRSTADLMTAFYEAHLGEGEAPAAALRRAQLKLLANPGTSTPLHWAGFIFQGEWRGTPDAPAPRPSPQP